MHGLELDDGGRGSGAAPSHVAEDPFYRLHSSGSPVPPARTTRLMHGDRLMLIGDSITEARRFSRIVETYCMACVPQLQLEVRNLGKGGETASQFTSRMEKACLSHPAEVAVVGYGMNDAGYINSNPEGLKLFVSAISHILSQLHAANVRRILASPGCIGRLPPWPFVEEQGGSLDGLNWNLLQFRDQTARLADSNQLPFVDHFWNLYRARLESAVRHDADFAICGLDDGVHPSWAGHVVMAHGVLSALGMRGELGCLSIDLPSRTATTSDGHAFLAEKDATYTFKSSRYPFCANDPKSLDWTIRGGCGLVPFMRDYSFLRLVVSGATGRYRVAWMNSERMLEESHIYSAEDLENGINLADDFALNPFCGSFQRVEGLARDKQGIESQMTWMDETKQTGLEGIDSLAELESQRKDLIDSIRAAVVPVTHNIRLTRLE